MTMTEVSFPGHGMDPIGRERKSQPTPLEMRIRRECLSVRPNRKKGAEFEISEVIR